MQNQYNLLRRQDEPELMAMCADTGSRPGARLPRGQRRQKLAHARGVTMAQVALAWVLHNPAVCAPIVGATRSHHLPEAIAALELKLTGDEIAMLEKPYSNHGPSWY